MNLLDMSERSSKDQVPEIFEQQRRRQSDQGTPDGGMSSVSKTAISEDEQHQAVRSNMIHQFEREVLISKLAEIQMVSRDDMQFFEDQCHALTDEIKQSAVDKSVLRERVAELEKELSSCREKATPPRPNLTSSGAQKQGWTTLLTQASSTNANLRAIEARFDTVRVWTRLSCSLLVLYDSPTQERVLEWADLTRAPVRAFENGTDELPPFRFEIGNDVHRHWIFQCADMKEYSSWHGSLSAVPALSLCTEARANLDALHVAPQVNTTRALVSAVAQLAGTVQEMEMMRAECSNLNSKVGMLQAEIDTLRDSSAAENKRLDDLVASGETERALLKERVTQAVSKLRQSVNVERHQWIEEKKRLMEQLERARGKDRRLHHASTVVEREQEKQEQGEVDLGTTTVADVVED